MLFGHAPPPPPPPHISVAVGVIVGLIASFVQSLGLTIQRKSHLQNEALPIQLRKKDRHRPLWVTGFAVFICSNLLGTIFQIGALPIVVLGPLGAVSLLYNAFFARIILGDEFSTYLIIGTIMICGGAVLVGIFGVVPEETHTLDELVKLYSRPSFIIWISLLSLALALVAAFSHVAEWTLERRLHQIAAQAAYTVTPASPTTPRSAMRRRKSKRHSGGFTTRPTHQRSDSSPISQPSFVRTSSPRGYGTTEVDSPLSSPTGYFPSRDEVVPTGSPTPRSRAPPQLLQMSTTEVAKKHVVVVAPIEEDVEDHLSDAATERTRLIIGLAYGIVSGVLSGLCLLFAKTGIELLILTVVGQNQFGRFEAWLIVMVLLVAAVLQLFYLNRALRLVGPTLICPLAFCFYNLSSIISGLIYYNQWGSLSALQFGLVSLGTVILLAGVWVVSIRSEVCEPVVEGEGMEERVGLLARNDGESEEETDEGSDEEPIDWLPRGLTIGIGAVSPGFEIRPRRTPTLPSTSTFTHIPPISPHRSASEPDLYEGGEQLKRKRDRIRGLSLSGALYVGTGGRTSGEHGDESVEEEERREEEGVGRKGWWGRNREGSTDK